MQLPTGGDERDECAPSHFGYPRLRIVVGAYLTTGRGHMTRR